MKKSNRDIFNILFSRGAGIYFYVSPNIIYERFRNHMKGVTLTISQVYDIRHKYASKLQPEARI